MFHLLIQTFKIIIILIGIFVFVKYLLLTLDKYVIKYLITGFYYWYFYIKLNKTYPEYEFVKKDFKKKLFWKIRLLLFIIKDYKRTFKISQQCTWFDIIKETDNKKIKVRLDFTNYIPYMTIKEEIQNKEIFNV